jgi:predicted dehydrogenase
MTVRLGVVGFGYWGPNLARNFDRLPRAELAVCCDLDPSTLEKLKNLYPYTRVTTEYRDILEDHTLDGVVIATSAVTHYQFAKEALNHGKHVFVEKPLSLRYEEGRELVQLAEERSLVLMVGHLLLYHPAILAIKDYIDSGKLGRILYAYSQRLNLGKLRTDENCLWSLGPHDISVILYLLGQEPAEVSARGESYLRQGIEDVVFLTLTFGEKTIANIHISWLDPHKIRKVTIVGSEKMVVFDDMESAEKIRMYDKGVDVRQDYKAYGDDLTLRFGDIVIPSIKMEEPLRAECKHFVECIEEKKRPRSDGRDGLRVLKVLEAAQESLDSRGKPVPIRNS